MCALSVWQDQTACQILAVVRVSMHHAVMRICISHRLFICAQNGFFGDFEGEYVKILCSDPQNALPCVNTRLLVYRVS